ncbi:MAG TPA: preprotein translocase subunit YajC [bacterium]
MADTPATPSMFGGLIVPLLMLMLIWYVIVLRPQTKERKAHQALLAGLKKHDEVVTMGGLIGTVVNLKPQTVTLRVDENVRIEVERTAIARVLKDRGESQPSAGGQGR